MGYKFDIDASYVTHASLRFVKPNRRKESVMAAMTVKEFAPAHCASLHVLSLMCSYQPLCQGFLPQHYFLSDTKTH